MSHSRDAHDPSVREDADPSPAKLGRNHERNHVRLACRLATKTSCGMARLGWRPRSR